jgi:ABC-2 type transport system permease protein
MLWYKAWLETRWRFLIGLGVLILSAAGVVFTYPKVLQLLHLVPSIEIGGEIGRRIREAAELSREYRGYVWSQAFRQNLAQTGTLFAVLLGAGGLVSGSSALFTLSLPVSRGRLVAVRAATGLAEWFLLALVPALVIPMLSPAIGEHYAVGAAIVHALCLFITGAIFFSLALLLSTLFADPWRPVLIALFAAIVLVMVDQILRSDSYGLFGVMSGEAYFRAHRVPWAGLLGSIAASATLLYGASLTLAHRDF